MTIGTTGDPKKTNAPFHYTIKDSYSSRFEVYKEYKSLVEALSSYEDVVDDETRVKTKNDSQILFDKLKKEAEKFPKGPNEIFLEKEMMLENEVSFLGLEFECNPDYEVDKDNTTALQRMEQYKKAYNIQKEYKDGSITIDEALKALGLK